MKTEETLRIIVIEAEDGFVAQCLEYDICTQGATREILRERMDCLITVELEETAQSGQSIGPAPGEFHKMWDNVVTVENGSHQYGVLPAAA